MFQLHVARGFRASINQTLSFALRDGRFAAIACRRLPLRSQVHLFHANVTRRSYLNAAIKVHSSSSQPMCSARYLSTSSRHLSDDGNLVYTGNLARAVLGAKFFCYSTSGFNLCMTPYILLKTGFAAKGLALTVAFCSFIGVFTFITPVLLHLVTKGYVLRLYHNPDTDTYTAVTYNVLLNEKKTVFHQKDVKIPDIHRMFTTFFAGKMPLLVNPDLFPSSYDYNHLMGYDKPFSFDLDDLDKPDKS